MTKFLRNAFIGFSRCMLPFSFIVALVLSPRLLMSPLAWPELWVQMWSDP